ncbi:MAG: dephospho-CoA kinase [Verrucomicrobia bacterium]|nr:dephospho-CoA kinase [Verrucomicrobiota bacterium]
MLTLKKVAVTGGLSSGKSTVCRLFEELGSYAVSADIIVHQLLSPDTAVGQQVINLLGSDIVRDRQFDRKKIADKVFSDPDSLRALEKILHPAVFDEIKAKYLQIQNEQKYSLFVAEIPLLYESESEDFYDAVIAVMADPAICRQRFKEHRQQEDLEFDRRMNRQLSPMHKAAKAQFLIENNGSIDELKQNVANIYSQLTKPSPDPYFPK